ncbi:outer membrane beta-barrel protein [Vibrio nigripulchritudo]|uniref:outer membrane beta-barrel protein n=1 Tax=Vibrio nigripulchritudo TaxID=28173 RepID=UPI0005FA017C|nr:outer membrane beta-barrel protein [Vibrio nigripulchritudo]
MKKSLLPLALLSLSFFAQAEEGYYFGAGYNISASENSGDKTGLSASFGHTFPLGSTFAASSEWLYTDLGKHGGYDISSIAWNLKPTLPLSDTMHVAGVFGTNYFFQESDKDKDNKFGISYGAELGLRLTQHIQVNTGYKIFNAKSQVSSMYAEFQLRF